MDRLTPSKRSSWHGARLLLVDDDQLFRETLAAVLEAEFAVDQASDLASARVRLRHRAYDVLVSDHEMPDGLGASLLEEVAKNEAPPALILITGAAGSKDVRAVNDAGRVLVLFKPFEPSELILWIRHAVAMRRLSRATELEAH